MHREGQERQSGTKKVVSNPSEIGYERLINSRGTGLLQTIKDAPYDSKGKFVNSKTQYPLEVVAALYDYKFVQEDRSNGIHNTTYAVQLLMDSIKALDKTFDDSKRPQ